MGRPRRSAVVNYLEDNDILVIVECRTIKHAIVWKFGRGPRTGRRWHSGAAVAETRGEGRAKARLGASPPSRVRTGTWPMTLVAGYDEWQRDTWIDRTPVHRRDVRPSFQSVRKVASTAAAWLGIAIAT